MNNRIKIFTLYLGAILINIVAGSINTWGTIGPYIASYYHSLDPSIYVSDFVVVNSYAYTFEALFTIATAYLIKIIQPFWIIVIGTIVSLIGFFVSSYITNPYLFCWVIGLSFGMISAFNFLPSIWIIWNQIPKNKPISSGIALCGFSLGSVFLGILFTFIVNPHNYEASTVDRNDQEVEKIFDKNVYERVPMTIRWCTLSLLIVFLISAIFLKRKWRTDNSENNISQTTLTFCQMLKNIKFWNLLLNTLFGASSFGYIINIYKVFGQTIINDDHFTSIIGSLGSFFSCFGRIFFGIMLEKYSWKRVMSIDYLIIALCFLTLQLSALNKYIYAFYVIALFFLITALCNGIIIQTDRDFPRDRWIVTYVSLGQIPALYIPFVFEKFLTPVIGYYWTFIVLSGITMVAVFQVIFHPCSEPVKDEMLCEKENIVEEVR